jgi:hypothetical protein
MRMTVDHQAFKEWYYPLYDSDKFIEYIESADYYGLAKLAFLKDGSKAARGTSKYSDQ